MVRERYARVRSKNHSCSALRHRNNGIGPFRLRSLVRLGSVTETEVAFPKSYGKYTIIEVNTVESIQNSRSKLMMKACFDKSEVKQSAWWTNHDDYGVKFVDHYPILAKRVFGFKGKGMIKIDSEEQLEEFINNTTQAQLDGYYFEKFHNYAKEYRLHCTKDECFMTWRKLRKEDAEDRWFFNSSNCNWVNENHELFDKPSNWDLVVEECCKAIDAVGLDIGCVDLRIQSSKKDNPEFIVVEVNSAPSLGEQGVQAYKEKITEIINNKI